MITGVQVAGGSGVFRSTVGVGKKVSVGSGVFVFVGGGVYMAVCVPKKDATNVSTAPVPETSGVAVSFSPQETKKRAVSTTNKTILFLLIIEITFLVVSTSERS